MNRYLRPLAVALGTLSIVVAVGLFLILPASSSSPVLAAVVGLVAFIGVAGALWKVAGVADDEAVAPPPWSEAGALTETAPERSRSNLALSGTGLGETIERSGKTARAERSVADGVAVVRPELRAALLGALAHGRGDRDAAEAALAAGTWTDDPLAASALDEDVAPPDRPLRRRVEAWLYPEREVARRTARAVRAMAAAADEALPPVVGRDAPRNVPVLPPTLEDLRRATDGHLRPAVDSPAVSRDLDPARPDGDAEQANTGRAENDARDERAVDSR